MIRSNLILTMMVALVAFGVSSCDNTTIASAEIEIVLISILPSKFHVRFLPEPTSLSSPPLTG